MPRPAKRAKLLTDDSDAESSGSEARVASSSGFKVNQEYAKRFEHNKKREEKQRLEEKYGAGQPGDNGEDESDESTDESEDDDAELATADVDEEIFATLAAIKRKDPALYDNNVKFYKDFDAAAVSSSAKTEKPMYLRDYHRENLLNGGAAGGDEDEDDAPQTYQQEQDALKRDLVGAMQLDADEDEDEGEEFLVAKSKPKLSESAPKTKVKRITEADVEMADKDPETFLSNFMAARAWLPTEGSQFQPFESDDSEDEARAEEYEEAYNMRYENPAVANETLRSFARDVGKYSVRREEVKGRKKARDREREKKEAEKQERDTERARLRRLKLEEAEEKVKRIKHAAGMSGKGVDLDQWRDMIDGEFDDDKWESEMQRRFGDAYYAEDDDGNASAEAHDEDQSKRKPKKPKWDDDIDIGDIVPDFDEEEKGEFALSDDGEQGGVRVDGEEDEDEDKPAKKPKTKKDRANDKAEAKRAARKERRQLEEIVDAALPLSHPNLAIASSSKQPTAGFRYRETSPTSFGLTSRDILFASDAQLNEFAGLKKMAAFRDEEKKRRDRKKFSKKARLRQWRKDTFGKEAEPSGGFENIFGSKPRHGDRAKVKDGDKKRKRDK